MHDQTDNSSEKMSVLREMILTYERDVWNFAFSIIRRQDVADDISQEVFIKAYRNIHSFRGESSMKTWLLTITRNLVNDYRRSAFIRKVTLIDYIWDRGTHPSAEDEAFGNFVVKDVWQAVMKLPDKLREAFVLYVHNQLSISEIAILLNISEAAVKSRLHKARQKVSNFLMKEEGEADARV